MAQHGVLKDVNFPCECLVEVDRDLKTKRKGLKKVDNAKRTEERRGQRSLKERKGFTGS